MAKPQSLQEQQNWAFIQVSVFFPSQKRSEAISSAVTKQCLYLSITLSLLLLQHTNQHTHSRAKTKLKTKGKNAFSEFLLARLLLLKRQVVIQRNNPSRVPGREERHFCVGRAVVVMYKRDTVLPSLRPNFTLSFSCRERV